VDDRNAKVVTTGDDGLAEAAPSTPSPRVAVYAAAVGLATAVPVPFVDQALSGLARGAALRRVAERRGVRLSRGARDVLTGAPVRRGPKRRLIRRILSGVVSSALAPVRLASRFDDALSMWAAALLLDHYLRVVRGGPEGRPLGPEEAMGVRRAIDSAEVEAVLETLRAAPRSFVGALGDAARSVTALDREDRSPAERVVDTLLDAAATAPDSIALGLCRAFEAALDSDLDPDPQADQEEGALR